MAVMTNFEWYMLELVNRARLDPQGEAARYSLADLNDGLPAGTISTEPKSPLAPNDLLTDAARGHSSWMLANNAFSHTGQGGSTPFDRMQAAGYNFTAPYGYGENLSGYFTTGTLTNSTTLINTQHGNLFLSPGHRANILNDSFKQIGIGQVIGGPYTYNGTTYNNASLITQDYAYSAAYGPWFITGTHWVEVNGDYFYTPGEGQSGTEVSIRPAGGGIVNTYTTQSHGGYAAEVLNGSYDVSFYNPSFSSFTFGATVTVNNANVKLDLVRDPNITTMASSEYMFLSSADIVLPANPVPMNVRLLGAVNANATGNDDVNLLWGSKGANTLSGLGGADFIMGEDGDDTIYGGGGSDSLNGNRGSDTIYGGMQGDSISGGDGADTIYGGNGADTIYGDAQADTIHGGSDGDEIWGGNGNDTLYGDGQSDTLRGGNNDDTLWGGNGNDKLYGEAQNDTLHGGNDADELWGGGGADTLYGEAQNDVLHGGLDNDVLWGGGGNDTLYGEGQSDTLHGGYGDDVLWGGGGNDTLYGEGQNDTLHGGLNNDVLWGGTGNDTLYGDDQNDDLHGGLNDDTLIGGKGSDRLWGDGQKDTFVYRPGFGTDKVMDFQNNVDKIDLQSWNFADVATALNYATQVGAHVKFDFSGAPGGQTSDQLWVYNAIIAQLGNDIIV